MSVLLCKRKDLIISMTAKSNVSNIKCIVSGFAKLPSLRTGHILVDKKAGHPQAVSRISSAANTMAA